MEAAKIHKKTSPSATSGPGELVLQNGRQAGARRPLDTPATFIGRNAGCDIRLNVEGVDPMHCVLVIGPEGVQLRDLNSVRGSYVNGSRVESVLLRHGDILNVGPFQFRAELSLPAVKPEDTPAEDYREALRIQAAAIAAQQIALEEEEARLLQRRSELQQQEEQLAAHLADKQRQVQLWSEYTQTERETLRKEKIDQEKRMAKLEEEILKAQQALSKDHEQLAQERQRITQVHQRLRQRWQKQWAAEKEKYQQQGKKLQAEALTLEERQHSLRAQEASLTQDVLRFNTERELGIRQLQENRDALTKAQESWRRRRSQEFLALQAKQRTADEAQIKLRQARQLLVQEKDAWDKQLGTLQKELHGLNNRIVHQRLRIQERTDEIARIAAVLRERQAQVSELPRLATELVAGESEETLPECEVVIVADDPTLPDVTPESPAPAEIDAWQCRSAGLDRMASDLADQRVQLIEQYTRLAEIQEIWQQQRDQASAELEALAQRLLAEEQVLADRARQTAVVEATHQQRQHEIDAIREEIQLSRGQLKARELTIEQEHNQEMLALRQHEALLQEQLVGLASLRKNWNRRRQQEIGQLRSNRSVLEDQQKETQQMRLATFEKGQQIEEEKRILAEKALALEQYRQEVFFRANDPAAQRRVERLRRRWLTLNAALIRNAKSEREATKKDLLQLQTQRAELVKTVSQLTENDTAAAEQKALLEVREAVLKARHLQLEQELSKLESQRHQSEEQHLRLQDAAETLAQVVFEEEDAPAIDKAA
jgi:pSer/pThr/pTyr-binding forkhead associated (FHA) protein